MEDKEGSVHEPVLSDRRKELVAKRLVRLICRCAEWPELEKAASAAEATVRALIELDGA